MSCQPSYSYRPIFVPSPDNFPGGNDSSIPTFIEKRSRLFAGGTFFRSKNASSSSNLIQVEYISVVGGVQLNVYSNGTLVESFGPVPGPETPIINPLSPPPTICVPTVNSSMRLLVNDISNFIQMPQIDFGGESASSGPAAIFDASHLPTDVIPGDDCSNLFLPTFLTGSSGPPEDNSSLLTIRTGPERSLVVVTIGEIINDNSFDDGQLQDLLPNEKIRQWDGFNWIPFITNADCI